MQPVDAPGGLRGTVGPSGEQPDRVIIDNRTSLPDEAVREAVMAQWVESAALQFGTPSTFQLYATNQGSNMLARSPFRTPTSILDEVRLARQVADCDDDVAAVINQVVHTAYRDGMQNLHSDEATLNLFNRIAYEMNLDLALKEMLREYVISGQVNTLSLFTRSRLNFTPSGTETRVQAQLSTPLVGVLPAENIRVMSMDVFGTGELAYEVTDPRLKDWLDTFFSKQTTAAKRRAMEREQPVISALFTGKVTVDYNDQDVFTAGKDLYTLNPRMVHRTTMPKGSGAYPRPRMTANFALLEAKRLLNIMDYSLLQGGTNYIVVAKQGSDQLPAQQPEIDNLTDQVRSASRTGVLVGDHRLEIDIITPKLEELLNPAKRKLIGRKLAMALLCIPEQVTPDPGNEGARSEGVFAANTVTSDRHDIKRHMERFVYEEIVRRNPSAFPKGAPSIWHSQIVLSGVKEFFDNVVKARDRGDIPRKWAVEVLGFDYEAGVAQRQRELEAGHDEIMIPVGVPFSEDGEPSDTPEGRPSGGSSDNGRPGARRTPDPAQRQRRVIPRARGEAIRAEWDEGRSEVVRAGELTSAVIEQYPGFAVGRVTDAERAAVTAGDIEQYGPLVIVPVNPGYDVRELRALRLEEGLSMIVGNRVQDGAVVARALCFREPHFDVAQAGATVLRWGFATAIREPEPEPVEILPPTPPSGLEIIAQALGGLDSNAIMEFARTVGQAFASQVVVNLPGEGAKEIIRDEHGHIVGTRPLPAEQ